MINQEAGNIFNPSYQQGNSAYDLIPNNIQSSTLNMIQNGSLNNIPYSMGVNENVPSIRAKTKLSKPQRENIISINEIFGIEQEKYLTPPPQEIIDNMKFIFNSMGKNNVPEKAHDLKKLLVNDNIIKWFSDFFIVNRVSVEINNHQSYYELISLIKNKDLNDYLIKDTINYIQKMLSCDALEKDLKQKNILKNLGSWLGLMTLCRNKPILANDLDFKEILMEAYSNGRLGPIVTFISRVLEHSGKSKVFTGTNPWLKGILSMLNELNSNPNLKPNLTFEIEGLFKKLDLDLNKYLKSKIFEKLKTPSNSPDFVLNPHHSKHSSHHNTAQKEKLDQMAIQELSSKIINLDNYIIEVLSTINNNSSVIVNRTDLVNLLGKLLFKCIDDIINQIEERAISVSLTTTKKLTKKDFFFEMDPNKYKEGAYNTIKSLSGSLALVSCKEPLRFNFNKQFQEHFKEKNNLSEDSFKAISSINHSDLLQVGYNYIYNRVIKKATDAVLGDNKISSEIERREKGKKPEKYNETIEQYIKLPEILRPSFEGLTDLEWTIYDNYKKMNDTFSKFEILPKTSYLDILFKLLKESIESIDDNPTKIAKKYEVCMLNIQNITQDKEKDNQTESEEFKEMLNKLEQYIIDYKEFPPETVKGLAKVTFKYFLNSIRKNTKILFNIYSSLIKGWIQSYEDLSLSNESTSDSKPKEKGISLSEELTKYMFTFIDIRHKFSSELHSKLISKGLINQKEYQREILLALENNLTREDCRILINELKSEIKLENILPFMYKKRLCETYFTLFSKDNLLPSNLNIRKQNLTDCKICNIINQDKYISFKILCSNAYDNLLDTKYSFQTKNPEKSQERVNFFLSSPFISNPEQNISFFMIITELCINKMVEKEKDKDKEKKLIYYSPDDEAKIIYYIINNAPNSEDKLRLFNNFLFGFFRTLNYDYIKSQKKFNQRPYYKLLFNFIYLLSRHKNNELIFNGNYPKIRYFLVLSEVLKILHPKTYPGFALAWLDLLSSKYFVCTFLENEPNTKIKDNLKKYEKYLYLVIDLFTFVTSLSNESFSNYNIRYFMEKVYKYIFVLCQSFPDFISNYYFYLLMTLPYGDKFMQIKNLILSCGQNDIERTDPFKEEPNGTQEKRKYAVIYFDIANVLEEHGFKNLVTQYIETKSTEVIKEIANQLNSNNNKDSNNFNIGAIIVYWSQKVLKHAAEKNLDSASITNFFFVLIKNLEEENRDHLINAMLNEIRFPSIQTLFFSDFIILLLREIKIESIEEHIFRNLCERMIYKPIPWGICRTFAHIMNNQNYKLKQAKFYINNPLFAEKIQQIYESAKNDSSTNYI
ncbi:MAG: DUF3819 domain-containing protein [archaeon]|nr:DUF3819 domain-containing protein [archaeon]